MTAPELSQRRRLDTIGAQPVAIALSANADERAALAKRFGLLSLNALEAELSMMREGDIVTLTGHVRARAVQPCVATGEPVPTMIDEPLMLRFVPEAMLAAHDEVELGAGDTDVVGHDGNAIDVGEAVAETLALALDPFPRSPGAAAALKSAGVIGEDEVENGAFAGLAALRDQLRKG